MFGMDWYLISVLIFVGILAVLIYKNRKKIKNEHYIFYRYDTQKGKNLIDNIAKSNPKSWKYFGSFGIFVGFLSMILISWFLISSLVKFIIAPQTAISTVALVIPIPFEELAFVPGFLGVPFWYWIISVAVLMVVHEGMHGIMLRVDKLKIKSLGIFILAIIPGAFVEPDEKKLNKANWKSRLRVYAAGTYANLITGFIFLLILTAFVFPVYFDSSIGFSYYSIREDETKMPAQLNNLTGSIYSIDGERVSNLENMAKVMTEKNPNQVLNIKTVSGSVLVPFLDGVVVKNLEFKDYEIQLDENGKIGIGGFYNIKFAKQGPATESINFFGGLLVWICLLNIFVGLVNMLPIKPLDGGLMIDALSKKFIPKYSDKTVKIISALFLAILLGNLAAGFII